MADPIDRQAAIDAIHNADTQIYEGEAAVGRRNYMTKEECCEIIDSLPSAQPEPCVDTIDALDESIKHFDDMAEECRRNANIEQNDYMDMRDDAAEYRQLSIWLNELKWLRERFQSQPDMSEYSDKLWKKAYERGRAEAQQRWIPCSERLPENGHYYLWCSDMGNVQSDYYWDGFENGMKYGYNIVAWMPLPEPYKGEQEWKG